MSTKIRIRGKGSSFIERNVKEGKQPLMLFISSLNYHTYKNCISLVDQLLDKVYDEYYKFCLSICPKETYNSIKRKNVIKYEHIKKGPAFYRYLDNNNKCIRILSTNII